MSIIVVGLNHKTAPIEIREKLSFSPAKVVSGLAELKEKYKIPESVILSTCNRVEIYGAVNKVEQGVSDIKRFLSEFHKIPPAEFEKYLYVFSGEDAVKHLLKVTASLDSMVVGEPQIFGQVKETYFKSLELNSTGAVFNGLFHRVIKVVKKIHTDTEIGRMPVSVSSVAVNLAKKIYGDLKDNKVMILGAGEMSELTAKCLMENGVKSIFVSNRTFEKAGELARAFNGQAVKYDEFPDYMVNSDIVISSTGAPHYIIKHSDISSLMLKRKNKPMFFIDISIPRNIDPAINEIDNVYLYNIDDLRNVADENQILREKTVRYAEEIIEHGVRDITSWYNSLSVVPTIVSLRQKAEELRREELQKTISKLNGISQEDKAEIDFLTQSLVNKLLSSPIDRLKKNADGNEAYQYTDLLRYLFKLDENDEK